MQNRTYSLGLYEKAMPVTLSWKEKLLAAKEAGYDFLEISIDETEEKLSRLDMPAKERLELSILTAELGIPIHTMCLSGHRKYPLGSSDQEKEAHSLEIMEKALTLASDLGIRIIQLAGYDVYYEDSTSETIKRFKGNLKKAAMLAAKSGVMLGFETMETEFMNTVEKAMNYVDFIDSAYLTIYPDVGNLTNAAVLYETDVLEDLKKGKGNIAALHLKETMPGKYREVPYGSGHVDFEKVIRTAWEIGVRKYVTEFWYVGSHQWKQDLLEANEKMRTILDSM